MTNHSKIFNFFIRWVIVVCLFGTVLFLTSLQTHNPPTISADNDFQIAFQGIGNYGLATGGVGTRGNPATGEWTGSGEIILDIPVDANIVEARLIWTGRSDSFDSDGVQLQVDGGTATIVIASNQYEQSPWCCSGSKQIHESADISAYVQAGQHVYTISDHEHSLEPTGNHQNFGVGIWAVYETYPYYDYDTTEIIVLEGQDSFFRRWDPPRGPHSEVKCVEIEPLHYLERKAQITQFVAGIDPWDSENNQFRQRSVAIWFATGDGVPPPADEIAFGDPNKVPSLALHPNAKGVGPTEPGSNPSNYPLQGYSGLGWDNFQMQAHISYHDEWICLQIESGDSQDLAGLGNVGLEAAGMVNMLAMTFQINGPGPLTDTPSPTPSNFEYLPLITSP